MAYKPTGRTVPRPKPTTWQEEDQFTAQDRWDEAGGWVDEDRRGAAGRRDTTFAEGGAAVDAYNRRPVGAETRAFTPSNVQGYSPTQMQQWMSALTMAPGAGARPGAGAGAPSMPSARGGAGSAAGAGGGAGFASSNLASLDTSALDTFDPAAAGKEFAKGAYGDFQTGLADNLRTYDDEAVAAGRLRTGQYDVGKGQLVTRMGQDFDNRLAQAALDFSGQRLSAVTAGTTARLSRASDMDANARSMAELNAKLGFDRERGAAGDAIDYERLGNERYGQETDRYGLGLKGASAIDEMGWGRATALDEFGRSRATGLDAMTESRAKTGLDAALDRESRYSGEYGGYADRSGDYLSGSLDRAGEDRDAQDYRDWVEQQRKRGFAGGAAAQGAAFDPNAGAKETARKFGVPWSGR
mgnify:FL=1